MVRRTQRLSMEPVDLQKLAGILDKNTESMGENLTVTASEKAEYQKQHAIQPGTEEWFRLWFAQPRLTGESPFGIK